MGLILSLLRRIRRKPSTDQVLEGVEEDIVKYEQWQQQSRHLQYKIVLILVLFSAVLYVAGAAILYWWLLPDQIGDRLLCVIPFLAFPILVLVLRRVLHFFFVTRINRFGNHLKQLKEKKKTILESVTETEKYKVAKELLEKYDPKGEYVKREITLQQNSEASGLRQRNVQRLQTNHSTPQLHPGPAQQINTPGTAQPGNSRTMQQKGRATPVPAFPILPRERTPFDKMAEYFIGDGPSYRYALICKRCKHHNGMALKDEFEFAEYHCCYCGCFNPARTKRCGAPPLFELDNESDEVAGNETQEGINVTSDEENAISDNHSSSGEENSADAADIDDNKQGPEVPIETASNADEDDELMKESEDRGDAS